MEIEDYVTVSQAAKELAVGLSAVNNALAKNRLPYVVTFGRKVISRSDLDAYKQRTRPDGEKPKGRPRKQKESRLASNNAGVETKGQVISG